MTISELHPFIRSSRGSIQNCIIYSLSRDRDLASCVTDTACVKYGSMNVRRLQAQGDDLIITVD